MIYLDNNATTVMAPEVREAVIYCVDEYYANTASISHYEGIRANCYLEECRAIVAQLIDAEPRHLSFNSGASEANNTVIRAVADYYLPHGRVHIITSAIEHKCLLNICQHLDRYGVEVTYLPVDSQGRVCLTSLQAAIRPDTRLISIMAANNETGVLQPLDEIGAIARRHNILFHTDAAQWVGKLPFSVAQFRPDFVSLSAHKFYGPKGIGALYCSRPEVLLNSPLIHGGGQESGLRSGTVNLPGAAGMAKAAELFIASHQQRVSRQQKMKQHFIDRLLSHIPDAVINGCRRQSLPNTVNFSVPGVKAGTLLKKLKMKVALSSASACHSAEQKPSHVLSAMGLDDAVIQSAIRLSFGYATEIEELDSALDLLVFAAQRLRGIA
ncbi:cysteine desulfurase family protein [Brenneria sp. g21c3]|uniref:cysteine desulfurase family protein n=1 Tax=Brenneria sp. g21c3 TaxID=3093893 RepID=UPI002EB9C5BB|nr:cysteine desulfurase family protein [Brenneria sp. g21c3]